MGHLKPTYSIGFILLVLHTSMRRLLFSRHCFFFKYLENYVEKNEKTVINLTYASTILKIYSNKKKSLEATM